MPTVHSVNAYHTDTNVKHCKCIVCLHTFLFVSVMVCLSPGQAGRGGDRPLGRCWLQHLQSHRPLRLHAVSPSCFPLHTADSSFLPVGGADRWCFLSFILSQWGRAAGPDSTWGEGKKGNVTKLVPNLCHLRWKQRASSRPSAVFVLTSSCLPHSGSSWT